MKSSKLNLTMIMDLYELTMANGIFNSDMRDTVSYFDMFFRRVPDKGGYAIMAGLEQLIEYMENLKFEPEDIEYLRSLNLFCDEVIDYLKELIKSKNFDKAFFILEKFALEPLGKTEAKNLDKIKEKLEKTK